jgi:hypothetical protein
MELLNKPLNWNMIHKSRPEDNAVFRRKFTADEDISFSGGAGSFIIRENPYRETGEAS